MSESVSEKEDPVNGNLTYVTTGMNAYSNYQTIDYDSEYMNRTNETDYVNPFTVPAVRIIFIFLYSLVFACCFFGKFIKYIYIFTSDLLIFL